MYPPATVSMWWTLGPICGFGPVLISKAEPLASVDGRRSGQDLQTNHSRHAGELRGVRAGSGLAWPGLVRTGRAGFPVGEPRVLDRTTANSLPVGDRRPRQGDQVVKTKPLARSCSRVLEQSLGPTRARD